MPVLRVVHVRRPGRAAPAGAGAAAPAAAAPAPQPVAAAPTKAGPPFAQAKPEIVAAGRKMLYDGSPSWRAYLGYYVVGVLGAIIVPVIFNWIGAKVDASTSGRVLFVLIPLSLAAIYFAGLYFYRKSIRLRVTNTNIETERGILSKKIDVLELWRCRDVRYKQTLIDRMLGIAHIEIFTTDATTPNIEMVGLPASRELFEKIRDAIEIQRQSKNVYGVVS